MVGNAQQRAARAPFYSADIGEYGIEHVCLIHPVCRVVARLFARCDMKIVSNFHPFHISAQAYRLCFARLDIHGGINAEMPCVGRNGFCLEDSQIGNMVYPQQRSPHRTLPAMAQETEFVVSGDNVRCREYEPPVDRNETPRADAVGGLDQAYGIVEMLYVAYRPAMRRQRQRERHYAGDGIFKLSGLWGSLFLRRRVLYRWPIIRKIDKFDGFTAAPVGVAAQQKAVYQHICESARIAHIAEVLPSDPSPFYKICFAKLFRSFRLCKIYLFLFNGIYDDVP